MFITLACHANPSLRTKDKKQRSTSVSSQTLEEAFLSNKTAEVNVVKGQREYILSFNGKTSCQCSRQGFTDLKFGGQKG